MNDKYVQFRREYDDYDLLTSGPQGEQEMGNTPMPEKKALREEHRKRIKRMCDSDSVLTRNDANWAIEMFMGLLRIRVFQSENLREQYGWDDVRDVTDAQARGLNYEEEPPNGWSAEEAENSFQNFWKPASKAMEEAFRQTWFELYDGEG